MAHRIYSKTASHWVRCFALQRFEALHAPGAGTDHAGLALEHADAVEALARRAEAAAERALALEFGEPVTWPRAPVSAFAQGRGAPFKVSMSAEVTALRIVASSDRRSASLEVRGAVTLLV